MIPDGPYLVATAPGVRVFRDRGGTRHTQPVTLWRRWFGPGKHYFDVPDRVEIIGPSGHPMFSGSWWLFRECVQRGQFNFEDHYE